MNKRILLAISTTHGISKLIERNLKHYGFEVILLAPYNEKEERFKYPSLLARLSVIYRRNILGDKRAKLNLQSRLYQQELEKKLNNGAPDYALFFLAQNFSQPLVEFVRGRVKAGGMVNYQWDGMDRYPLIYQRAPLFDRFFVFQPQDLDKAGLNILPTTSFYFDYDLAPLENEYDFYFIGSDNPDRSDTIVKFAETAKEKNWKLNFNILCEKDFKRRRAYYPENINMFGLSEVKGYENNLLSARKSKILVDFVISEHKGLSLRTFEALGHDKKLITTNQEIKKYDFYHPNNIFILTEDNFAGIEDFLAKPYYKIDENIKRKYGFGNWIRYILDIPPYQPILLPRE